MNLALISPNENSYSQTFIQAHKNLIRGKIFFYYNGILPTSLEGKGPLLGRSFKKRKFNRFLNRILSINNPLSIDEIVLAKSFREKKIEVVLAEFGMTGAEILPLCKKLNIPLFVYFHGFDAHTKDILKEYKKKYIDLFKYSSKIFVVSKTMEEHLQQLGCPKEKLILNPCAPNDSFLDIEPTYKQKKVIAIGRFVDKKAPYYTILAFDKVLLQHPDAKLHFAGDGELFGTCKNLVKYLGINKNVVFEGVITATEFKEHLKNSIVFVQHSITALSGDKEGTPVTILEAQLAGIPIVSTKHAGITEAVVDGETGFLVEEGDVDGMAEKISFLLENNNKASEMGMAGKKWVSENFSMSIHIKIIEDALYGDQIKSNPIKLN